MLRLTIAVCTLALCLGLGLDDEWAEFKSTYGKTYNLAVEQYRKNIFASNLIKIAEHNNKADLGLSTYRLGVNEYADLSSEEFKRFFLGFKYDATITSSRGETYEPTIADHELPKEVDWRSKGYVTPVKNQKQCGSCWAFSTTGSLEGQHFKATGKLVSLSEQNLMDCSKKEGNMGCEGGLMDQAFSYVKKNDGLDTETSYPYEAKDEKCHFRKLDVGATLKAYKDIAKHSEKDLEKAVAEIGPISVAIDASHASFQLYRSGVYNEPKCSQKMLDHGVLAVGFGEKEGKKYWLVKNSWGATWGEKGYIMMSKDKDNQCGIATQASFPVCNK